MSALADTLRQLAAELPPDSQLALEFATVARSIELLGVLGAWRRERMVAELVETTM